MEKPLKHIVITGASSGIGEALALTYAGPEVLLSLTARNPERLNTVMTLCRAKGAQVHTALINVTDGPTMTDWLIARDSTMPVDLLIANAGVSAGTEGLFTGEDSAQIKTLFDVNFFGVLNTIEPLKTRMIERQRGQIALMSSLAGYRGWAGAPAYCASKAAVRVYGQALRSALAPHHVNVTVICPGFVKSRMTAVNTFSMPFLMDTDKAARHIIKRLTRNPALIAFPWPMVWGLRFLRLLPETLIQNISQKQAGKQAFERPL